MSIINMKNIYRIVLATLLVSLFPLSPKLVKAEAFCSGMDLTITVTNVGTGEVLGTYTDLGSNDPDSDSIFTLDNVPYSAVLSFAYSSIGTPSYTQDTYYSSGAYEYSSGPREMTDPIYTAPPIIEPAMFIGGRTENICTAVPGYPGDERAVVVININNSSADYGFTCGVNQIVTQGQNANYVLQATPDTGYTPTVGVTMASAPVGPTMNGSPVQLNSGNSYTNTAVVPTGSLSAGTYILTFSFTDGTTPHDCQANLQVSAPSPTVDLDFNDSDGPVDVADQDSGLLSWSSVNADTCTASSNPVVPGWGDNNPVTPLNNAYPSGVTVGPLSGPQTYTFTLQCSNAGGSDSDSVVVNVGNPPPLEPTVTLECMGTSDTVPQGGPCTLGYNSSGTLFWDSTNASSCTIDPDLGGRIDVDNLTGTSTGNLTSNQSYTITCNGAVGTTPATDTVSFTIDSNPNFTMACSPATVPINQGDSASYLVELDPVDGFSSEVTLTGEVLDSSKNAPTLSFPTNTGTPEVDFSPVVSAASDTPAGIYNIRFTADGGGITKTCDVEVEVDVIPGPGEPLKVRASNMNCGTIDITWANPTGGNPDQFLVYRRASESDGWELLNKVDYDKNPSGYLLTDSSPLNPTSSNYYAVTASYGGAESGYALAYPSPIVPLSCTPNLTKSDKDLVKVSGQTKKAFNPVACSSQSEIANLPNNALFAPNDRVTFRINVCNSGPGALTGITITDDLSKNLSDPGDYDSNCLRGAPVYDSVAQTITFDLQEIAAGDVSTQSCSIEFTATVTAPAVTTAALYRFQNIASIVTNELPKYRVFTPPYLFSVAGGVPDRTETAP